MIMNINKKAKIKTSIINIFITVAVIIGLIWAISPFYWALITSIKHPVDTFKLSFIPWLSFKPTLSNWHLEFTNRGPELKKGMINSLIVSSFSAILALCLGVLAGYGLARFKFRRWKNKDIALWFISQRFLPPAAVVVPFFVLVKNIGLLDTKLGLILANSTFTIPFAVLIMKDAFKDLPKELEEAALVDGCSRWGVFFWIALPLAIPALIAAGIICFAFAWNEFLFALVLTYQNATPMTVLIAGTENTQGAQFWYVTTRLLMAILPPAIMALLVQRFLVRGLTFGAVKG